MDLMWLLILFGLFMLSILTVFISSVLNALVRQLHPLVYVVIVAALSYVFSNFFMTNIQFGQWSSSSPSVT